MGIEVFINFFTPFRSISSSGRSEFEFKAMSGSSAESSLVNTDVNWLFNMFALAFGLMCDIPFCLSGAMPDDSHFLLLMKDQNFLGFALNSSQNISFTYFLYASLFFRWTSCFRCLYFLEVLHFLNARCFRRERLLISLVIQGLECRVDVVFLGT